MLTPSERPWAERLAQAEAARQDLVRLVGLLNLLSTATAREDSLAGAARRVCAHLADYLLLDYCAFQVHDPEGTVLAGENGSRPSGLDRLLAERESRAGTYTERLATPWGERRVVFLPVVSRGERLGSLVLAPVRAPGERELRHYRLVGDAMGPVLETFLLRRRLEARNRELNQATLATRRDLAQALRHNLAAESWLEGLLDREAAPVFLLDQEGRFLRTNPALEHILGRPGQALYGRKLGEFLAEAPPPPGGEAVVCLYAQAGHPLRASLWLRPVALAGGGDGVLGGLRPEPSGEGPGAGAVPLAVVERLGESCAGVAEDLSDFLAALRTSLQLLLLRELDPELRRRLEMLEELGQDKTALLSQLKRCLDQLNRERHRALREKELWGPPAP